MAPVANRTVATHGFRESCTLEGPMAYPVAMAVVYIANEDGRRAVDAFHIPALNASMKKRYLPTRTLTFSTTER